MAIKASFIIPTLNAEAFLKKCLQSIAEQDFSKKKYEVLLLDGGSSDKTLKIAKSFETKIPIKILHNNRVDAESGKRLGISKSKAPYIILLDADNQIINKKWLKTGITILDNHPDVWGVESPWLVNSSDTLLNQYFSMLRITDPVARVFSPTSNQMKITSYADYNLVFINRDATPVIGANGFFYRKKLVKKEITQTKKFEEVNYVAELLSQGHQTYALLKTGGIYHYYCNNVWAYIKKRQKIAKKFLLRKKIKQKTWLDKVGLFKFFLAAVYNGSIIGPFIEAIFQYYKTKNIAWFYHPLISFITVASYSYYFLQNKLILLTKKS